MAFHTLLKLLVIAVAKKELRPHQKTAISAIIASLRDGKIPVASCSVGFGKSLILAELCEKALKQGKRVLQLVPTKELCEQNYLEMIEYTAQPHDIGICCAKLAKYQTKHKCVIATNTSFLSRRAKSGAFDLLLCDEAHLWSPIYESTYQKTYRSLLRLNPNLKLVGVTGTAYRSHGCITQDSVKGKATFNHLCYESNIPELIHGGFLSPIESISGDISIDLSAVWIKGGDYDTQKMGVKFAEICHDAVKDMRVKFEAYSIKTALIFASNIANAEMILSEWKNPNNANIAYESRNTMRIVHGEMTEPDRLNAINWIKSGHGNRYIVNVGVLTTGFNMTHLDCVVLMRATKSTGLYVQMVGRVLRAHDDKATGYLIDYGTNVERLGSVDGELKPKTIKKAGDAPQKICLECETVNLAAAKTCKNCGAEFVPDPNAAGLYAMRSKAEILRSKWQTIQVSSVSYEIARSKNGDIPMIRAEYYDEFDGLIVKQHLCLQHSGLAQTIAQQFLLKMFKNPREFYALNAAEGLNCVDVCDLLTLDYDSFFKKIVSVTIGHQRDSTKYFEIKGVVFSS